MLKKRLPKRGRQASDFGSTANRREPNWGRFADQVAQIEFLEWTDGDHLRHAKFVGLREDKDARHVVKEQAEEV